MPVLDVAPTAMRRTMTLITAFVLATVTLLAAVVAPAVAAPPDDAGAGEEVETCKNADAGPNGGGPPGFVGGLVPGFLGDLFSNLPVPGFLKGPVGASGC